MTTQLIINHLWQSSCFALLTGLLAFVLRKNSPKVRYWVWLSASLKFLAPFALLVNLGSVVPWPARHAIAVPAPVFPNTLVQIAEPFSPANYITVPAHAQLDWVVLAMGILWALGFLAITLMRCRSWFRIRATLRASTPVDLPIPVPAFLAPGAEEPGVVGFLRPVLVLPAHLLEHLNPRQLDAVLTHELCHVRRRDNLFAAVHMVVEAMFWFHPLVWWIGSRMVEERELACDEEVLRMGCEPSDYVEGILKVCRFYKESPLPCVSGVTGADVKKRLRTILEGRIARELNVAGKVALGAIGMAMVALPIVIGILNVPPVLAQQPVPKLEFEVASIRPVQRDKLNGPGQLRYNPQGVDFSNVPLGWVIGEAYGVAYNRISVSDRRINEMFFSPAGTDYFFNIAAKAAQPVPKEQIKLMLQSLLADRFSLVAHREPKVLPVYKLVAGKSGPKFQEAEAKGDPMCSFGLEGFVCRNVEMARFAGMLSLYMDRPVLDSTGLTASYDFTLSLQGGQAGGKAALVDWFSSAIFSDIERQLGLRLDADKGSVDYLVVDHAEKPSEN